MLLSRGQDGQDAVSTHAPLRQRGEPVDVGPSAEIVMFQPTPRFVSEANASIAASSTTLLSFNPRPASSARRTIAGAQPCRVNKVSTHAPLRQRGELLSVASGRPPTVFQPTPRFVSEANPFEPRSPAFQIMFQPTPRFVSEANSGYQRTTSSHWSFNPRPASSARRTLICSNAISGRYRFQPTPRFVSEANASTISRSTSRWSFNPRPASSARRTLDEGFAYLDGSFQPTPRFVSEANWTGERGGARRWCFNPRPASSARRTGSGRGASRARDCFNPRPASSARRTSPSGREYP